MQSRHAQDPAEKLAVFLPPTEHFHLDLGRHPFTSTQFGWGSYLSHGRHCSPAAVSAGRTARLEGAEGTAPSLRDVALLRVEGADTNRALAWQPVHHDRLDAPGVGRLQLKQGVGDLSQLGHRVMKGHRCHHVRLLRKL